MYLLVIYNINTGEIAATTTLKYPEEPLSGGIVVFVPDGKMVEKIDVSDPNNPIPIFVDFPVDEDRIALSIIVGGTIDDKE